LLVLDLMVEVDVVLGGSDLDIEELFVLEEVFFEDCVEFWRIGFPTARSSLVKPLSL